MPFIIRSREGATIAFAAVDASRYRVSVSGNGIQAQTDVWFREWPGLAEFFGGLATNWKGWAGEKLWESDEGEFAIRATANRLGHVTLDTTLLSRIAPEWQVQLAILVEAGQLDAIARDAAQFEKAAAAA